METNRVSAKAPSTPVWHLWVDTGGTFTDCIAEDPAGEVHRAKLLSTSCLRGVVTDAASPTRWVLDLGWDLPDGFLEGATVRLLGSDGDLATITRHRPATSEIELDREVGGVDVGTPCEVVIDEEAPVLAAHLVTGTPLGATLPRMSMRLATTRGTNALLQRRGARTVLFVTRGFADLLAIGNQQRPDLFALQVLKPEPLYETVVEVDERLDSEGEVIVPLDLESTRVRAREMLDRGIDTAAIAFLHSYLTARHELLLADELRSLGFSHVSCSAELAPRIKIVPRAQTTVVNAYLADVIETYLDRVQKALCDGRLHVLTSAGGLVRSAEFQPKDSLLSGPAGGVVGAAQAAAWSGFPRSLAFDMGGTSTDVSRFDGDYDYLFETRVGDAHLMAPTLAIETVAAGGGSICQFDGHQLKVGPESAGASPGPACYGAGGPLTLTDVNLLLGRLQPSAFEIPIDSEAAREAAAQLQSEVGRSGQGQISLVEMLEGLLDIANERMAEAVRRISIRRGYRPSDFVLVAFGGAGGQHACALAEILGVRVVLVPSDAGLLSAVGLGHARVERFAERQLLAPLEEAVGSLEALLEALGREAVDAVVGEGVERESVEVRRRLVYLRFSGQESTLAVEVRSVGSLRDSFLQSYADHYGYRPEERDIEVESVRVVASSVETSMGVQRGLECTEDPKEKRAVGRQEAFMGGSWQPVSAYDRATLESGFELRGPALVFEQHCSTVVDAGWLGVVDAQGCLVLTRHSSGEERS